MGYTIGYLSVEKKLQVENMQYVPVDLKRSAKKMNEAPPHLFGTLLENILFARVLDYVVWKKTKTGKITRCS